MRGNKSWTASTFWLWLSVILYLYWDLWVQRRSFVQTSIVDIPLLCLSVANLPMQQISEGKYIQTGGEVEVGPGKQWGGKEGLIPVGGKEIYAHLECANHYNLAQTLEIKRLCKILLSDLFLRFIKIMPEKQFLLLSLYLLQKLYIALEIFLFSHYHFKIDC